MPPVWDNIIKKSGGRRAEELFLSEVCYPEKIKYCVDYKTRIDDFTWRGKYVCYIMSDLNLECQDLTRKCWLKSEKSETENLAE